MKLELKQFDMSSIADDKVIVMMAKRGSGKSFLVRDLMYYHSDIPVGTVISPTESANKFFSHFVPNVFIHDDYKPGIIENFVKRQRQVAEKKTNEVALYGSCNIDPRAFLILDDCLYDSSWTKDVNVRSLFMNGRHTSCMVVITMQYPLGIPPNLRTNIDYVFILRENIVSNRKRLYEQYAGMFPSFDIFCQVLDQCTENYECLVIDNTSKSNKIEDIVFWYRAEERPDFRVGAPLFWVNNNPHGRANREDEEEFDPKFLKKKTAPYIKVKKSQR
jgi:hypothetical protein